MSGTARAAISIEEAERLEAELLADLHRFETGKLPEGRSPKAADGVLNATYARVLSRLETEQNATVNAEGVRTTQRTWLRYRDAWAHFGTARYPSTKPERWMAWASIQRIAVLKEVIGDGA